MAEHEIPSELHGAVMNLSCTVPAEYEDAAVKMGYRVGHRDARHAAAELVASSRAEQAERPVPEKDMHDGFGIPMSDTLQNAVHRVYFRAGLLVARADLARFVGLQNPDVAASIRAFWWRDLSEDPGTPRLLKWDEIADGGEEGPWTAKEVSPSVEALPIALQFLEGMPGEVPLEALPLTEPVTVAKALLAGERARVVLDNGVGPKATVHLVNIGLTGWVHTQPTAAAYAEGYNAGSSAMRRAIAGPEQRLRAKAASAGIDGQANVEAAAKAARHVYWLPAFPDDDWEQASQTTKQKWIEVARAALNSAPSACGTCGDGIQPDTQTGTTCSCASQSARPAPVSRAHKSVRKDTLWDVAVKFSESRGYSSPQLAISAAPDLRAPSAPINEGGSEPVAWAIFTAEGNIRIWSASKTNVEAVAEKSDLALTPLYAAPQASAKALTETVHSKLKELIGMQSEGEWDDSMIESDARKFTDALMPILAAEQSSEDMLERLRNPMPPFGMLVRTLRIVSGSLLMDMAKDLQLAPSELSAYECGRKPIPEELPRHAANYFEREGIGGTLSALSRARRVSIRGAISKGEGK
ncbi:hypothetical protein [Cupriavidus basilensis]|uniref:Phage DNA-binding protein n=1 Tax=Cupriavidus basilensis TaxID=68895 RepID=A0A0C4Y6Y7_9BURK|nr:hypothetical protein [Cupriavidus basilensis]AJG18800.1 Phage DNA-binding protein [Cupriavidus basilensis]